MVRRTQLLPGHEVRRRRAPVELRPRPGADGRLWKALVAPVPLTTGLAVAMGTYGLGPAVWPTAAVLGYAAVTVPGVRRARAVRTARRETLAAARAERRTRAAARTEQWEDLRARVAMAADRVEDAAEHCRPGPLSERLWEMSTEAAAARARVDDLVAVGRSIEEALATRPAPPPTPRSARNRRRRRPLPSAPSGTGAATLRSRRDMVERKVRGILASLEAAGTLALELAVDSFGDGGGRPVDDLVVELEALRHALDELRAVP